MVFHHTATPEVYTFPTRRSSDLSRGAGPAVAIDHTSSARLHAVAATTSTSALLRIAHRLGVARSSWWWRPRRARSEEHTSELQSRRDLVCRLLLEKKKTYKRCRS